MSEIKVFMNKDLKLIDVNRPTSMTQYSIIPVSLLTKIAPSNIAITMVFVRPDGYKVNEVSLRYIEQETHKDESWYRYDTEIEPFHTNIIPGTAASGRAFMSFIARELDGEEVVDQKASSILRLTFYRSQEPEVEAIEPSELDNLRARVTTVEDTVRQFVDLDPDWINEIEERINEEIIFSVDEPDNQIEDGIWMQILED